MNTKTTSESDQGKPLKFVKKSKYLEKYHKFNFNIEKVKMKIHLIKQKFQEIIIKLPKTKRDRLLIVLGPIIFILVV